jgi:hypothetical protein
MVRKRSTHAVSAAPNQATKTVEYAGGFAESCDGPKPSIPQEVSPQLAVERSFQRLSRCDVPVVFGTGRLERSQTAERTPPTG